MKKIFALCGPFVPVNEPMTLLPYKHLRMLDAEIDVVALKDTEDLSLKENLKKDKAFNKFNVNYIGNYQDALFSIRNVNLIKALYNVKKYIKTAEQLFESKNYDLLYSSSFPEYTHEAALKIKKKHNTPWIASFTDPINNSPYKNDQETYNNYSLPEKAAYLAYCHFYVKNQVEIDVLENADILVFICEEQKQFMFEQYFNSSNEPKKCTKEDLEKRSLILPLNYIDEWNSLNHLNNVQTANIVLSHFGRVYGLRKIDNFIYALHELLIEHPELKDKVKIEQYGEFRKEDIKRIKKLGMEENFIIHKKIPYEQCIQKMSESTALLIFDTILPEDSWQPYLPSKVLEYSLLRKNVFALTTRKSPTYRIMQETNGLAAVDEIGDIKDKLLRLIQGESSLLNYHYENKEIGQLLTNKINDLLS